MNFIEAGKEPLSDVLAAEVRRLTGMHSYSVVVTNLETGDVTWVEAQGGTPWEAVRDAATTPEELWKP